MKHIAVTATLALLAAPLAAPALADEVNIYSHRQPQLIQPLLDAFTAKTGIATNVSFLDKGLVEKLTAEGARTPADIVLTVDISRLTEAKAAGLLQPVSSPVLDAIPANLRDPEGEWFGLTSRARIVYASKERVAEGEVTTYEDLADPKWKGRICTRAGTHVYTLGLVSAYIAHHGEADTKAWLSALHDNLAKKAEGNDRGQIKSVWAGECDIALGNTYYYAEMLADPNDRQYAEAVRPVFPVFEGHGTHINISGVGMTKAAPHPKAALAFMEFLASAEAQQIYANVVYEYPVLPGAEPSDLVKSWGPLTPDDISLAEIASHRAAALRLVEEVDFDN